jgi:hypothetical protein
MAGGFGVGFGPQQGHELVAGVEPARLRQRQVEQQREALGLRDCDAAALGLISPDLNIAEYSQFDHGHPQGHDPATAWKLR